MVRTCTGLQIECVVIAARRMVGGDVERAEIMPVGFDMRPFRHRKPHGAEDGHHLLDGAADRVDRAGPVRAWRQGDVDLFGGEARLERRLFEHGAAGFDCLCQIVAQPVQRGAALATRLGGGLAKFLEQAGQRA
jgi:hypothetical protein